MPTLSTNKKALSDYQVLEKLEAGIVLSGAEVKSVKNGQINLKGSYVTINNQGEAWLIGAHISAYKAASAGRATYQPDKSRKLLLHQKEIDYLLGKTKEKGLTIMPISVYTKGSLIKLNISLVRGKKLYDKRESIKKREIDRQIRQKLKRF
ncbi:MAG: SsrA-binding protein SmpB [Patescibacteria group bacterium]|jgi:SsrA-binding protein